MAEAAESQVESHKCHGEKELDLKKCASDFAQYCQVDVTDEVRCKSLIRYQRKKLVISFVPVLFYRVLFSFLYFDSSSE